MLSKLTTLDLYHLDKCPKRWQEEPPTRDLEDPTRNLMKKIFLMKAIGRGTGWDFDSIASAWDQIFWAGKDITTENTRHSVQGILAARQLYKKIPKGELEVHSTLNLKSTLDAGVILSSCCDFLLSYSDRYEGWIYLHSTPKNIRRSPLPTLEHYLLQSSIRESHQKPFYLVTYYSSIKKRKALYFKIRDNLPIEETRRIVYSLAAKRKLNYPSIGTHCKECNIKC
jgi:hypothetical protein